MGSGQRRVSLKFFHPHFSGKMCFFARRKERSDSVVREVLAQAAVSLKGFASSDLYPDNNIPVVKVYSVLETDDSFVIEMEVMESKDLFDKLLNNLTLPSLSIK